MSLSSDSATRASHGSGTPPLLSRTTSQISFCNLSVSHDAHEVLEGSLAQLSLSRSDSLKSCHSMSSSCSWELPSPVDGSPAPRAADETTTGQLPIGSGLISSLPPAAANAAVASMGAMATAADSLSSTTIPNSSSTAALSSGRALEEPLDSNWLLVPAIPLDSDAEGLPAPTSPTSSAAHLAADELLQPSSPAAAPAPGSPVLTIAAAAAACTKVEDALQQAGCSKAASMSSIASSDHRPQADQGPAEGQPLPRQAAPHRATVSGSSSSIDSRPCPDGVPPSTATAVTLAGAPAAEHPTAGARLSPGAAAGPAAASTVPVAAAVATTQPGLPATQGVAAPVRARASPLRRRRRSSGAASGGSGASAADGRVAARGSPVRARALPSSSSGSRLCRAAGPQYVARSAAAATGEGVSANTQAAVGRQAAAASSLQQKQAAVLPSVLPGTAHQQYSVLLPLESQYHYGHVQGPEQVPLRVGSSGGGLSLLLRQRSHGGSMSSLSSGSSGVSSRMGAPSSSNRPLAQRHGFFGRLRRLVFDWVIPGVLAVAAVHHLLKGAALAAAANDQLAARTRLLLGSSESLVSPLLVSRSLDWGLPSEVGQLVTVSPVSPIVSPRPVTVMVCEAGCCAAAAYRAGSRGDTGGPLGTPAGADGWLDSSDTAA